MKNQPMNIKDLLAKGKDVAHCIGADATLGKGFAKELNKVDPQIKTQLQKDKLRVGSVYAIKSIKGYTYNMVSKPRSAVRPNSPTALLDCLEQLCDMKLKELHMPMIGCGWDGLKVHQVLPSIEKLAVSTRVILYVMGEDLKDVQKLLGKNVSSTEGNPREQLRSDRTKQPIRNRNPQGRRVQTGNRQRSLVIYKSGTDPTTQHFQDKADNNNGTAGKRSDTVEGCESEPDIPLDPGKGSGKIGSPTETQPEPSESHPEVSQ